MSEQPEKRTVSDVLTDLRRHKTFDEIPDKLLDELESVLPVPVFCYNLKLPDEEFPEMELDLVVRGLSKAELVGIRRVFRRQEAGQITSDVDFKRTLHNKLQAQVMWSNGYQQAYREYMAVDEFILADLLKEAGGDAIITVEPVTEEARSIPGFPADDELLAKKDARLFNVSLPSVKPKQGRWNWYCVVRRIRPNEYEQPGQHEDPIAYAERMCAQFTLWESTPLKKLVTRFPALADQVSIKLLGVSRLKFDIGQARPF